MGRVTVRRRVLRIRVGASSHRPDTLAAEEPMEIRVGGRPLTVTMRTPGDDFDLAVGFLVSEGVVHAKDDVGAVGYCAGATADGGNTYNVVGVNLALHVPAQRLLDEFTELGRTERWTRDTLWANLRGLRLVLAWVGAAAPIPEPDVAAVTAAMNCTVRRVVQFLDTNGLLIPDPARAIDPHHAAVQRMFTELPAHLAPEVTAWVQVLRGEGRKPSLVMRWQTIRQYVGYALPTLKHWGQRGDSLRGITVEDVRSAIKNHPGPGHQQLGALRSLFRALKRERLIFQDPTRHVRLASVVPHPVPLPTDRLRGLLNRAPRPSSPSLSLPFTRSLAGNCGTYSSATLIEQTVA